MIGDEDLASPTSEAASNIDAFLAIGMTFVIRRRAVVTPRR
jgi:hypothetical protein